MTAIEPGSTLQLLRELIAIPSVNPDLVPGAPGEEAIASHVCGLMKSWGLETAMPEAAPGRFNAIGVLRGSGGGRSLLFNGHIDTVSVEGMEDPFLAREEDGKLFGRGAYDMKGSAAAMLAAARTLAKAGPLQGDVVFTFVADEEYASIGSEAVVAGIRQGGFARPDAVINTEPTGLRFCAAHKGFAWAEIETAGVAAHGSRPDLGIDAIAKMGWVLVELERLQERLRASAGHPLLRTGSLHASLIEGGRELSTYPDRCLLRLERRTVPPETGEDVASELSEIIERLRRDDAAFNGTARVTFARNPWQADRGAAIAVALERAMERVLGRPVETMVQTGWLDVSLFAEAGIPSVVFGAGGGGAHALVEWADVHTLDPCAGVYVELCREFCGGAA